MSDPIFLDETSPRLALPLLFAAQAQKEFTVNEALLRADLVIQGAVEDQRNDPPATPQAGQAWLVGSAPNGDFTGHAQAIAGWTAGGWRFITPTRGWRVFDKAQACFRTFDSAWSLPISPPPPAGGGTIDIEARAAIAGILERLGEAGIFATS